MIVKTVKVSEKGQIAIPREMRKKAGINEGDDLIIVQRGDKLLLETTNKIQERLQSEFSDLVKLSEKSLMKLWDNKADEVWNKYLKK